MSAREVELAAEVSRLKAENEELLTHAEDMADWLQHGKSTVARKEVLRAYRAYRAAKGTP